MSFTNPKPGGYLTGERLPSAHVNTVWDNVAKAIDGDAGGTYAGPLTLSNVVAATITTAAIHTETVDTAHIDTLVAVTSLTVPGDITLASTEVNSVAQPLSPHTSDSIWTYSTSIHGFQQSTVVSVGLFVVALPNLIRGSTMTGVTVFLDGLGGTSAGTRGALPATKPAFSLYRNTPNAATVLIGSATDAPANVAAYEANHSIALTGLTEPIGGISSGATTSSTYSIEITGESGANSAVNKLALLGIVCTFSCTAICA